jgi:hypothetical protein
VPQGSSDADVRSLLQQKHPEYFHTGMVKTQGQYTVNDTAPARDVTIPDSTKNWIRPEKRSEGDAVHKFPKDVSDAISSKANWPQRLFLQDFQPVAEKKKTSR